jgi:hypothetical protein
MHSIQTLDRMVVDECYTVDISMSVISIRKCRRVQVDHAKIGMRAIEMET